MPKISPRRGPSPHSPERQGRVEWLGGRFRLPNFVLEDGPYRPDLLAWLELPSGLVVAHSVTPPDREGALADALRSALDRPTAGAAREPGKLRVADAAAAAELQNVFRERFPIDVAPTPELDAFFEDFLESQSAGDGDVSYLEGGRVAEPSVARMFEAAAMLYRAAPWKRASDSEVLRMDIPALGVEGACVSIIGALGESLGVIVFPSLLAYERFRAAAEVASAGGGIDFGDAILSLDFWRTRDLPPTMRREIAQHGWKTVAPDAVPMASHRDRDGVPRPLDDRDVTIATECAFAVASFFLRHGSAFGARSHEPICESSTMDAAGVTVRLTLPYEAADLFDPVDGPAATEHAREGAVAPRVKVGRNDPCPCGSGKKYKKCCLDSTENAASEGRRRAAAHELDERMVWTLRDFAAERYGARWGAANEKFERAAGGKTPLLAQISAPWSAYETRFDGERVVDAFLAECGQRLSAEEREWLAAQRTARLSLWEITACEPGVAVSVRSLLSGEVRRVREVRGSRTLVARDAILGRVVDYGGASYFCGMYPRMLPPEAAARVVKATKRHASAKNLSVDFPDEDLGMAMLQAWTKAVGQEEKAAAVPKQVANTDGEAFVFTTDHFEFDAAARREVAAKVRSVEGVATSGEDDDENEYTIFKAGNAMHRHWDNTVIGRVALDAGRLRLETNSVERADRLRERLERACGGLLRHRVREHADPLSSASPRGRAAPAPLPPPEVQAALRAFKAKHYAEWLDGPLPALSGKTPREAARTKRGREQVDVLLRTMENHEQRADGEPFDFGALRRELALDGEAGGRGAGGRNEKKRPRAES